MADRLVTIATFRDAVQAQIARGSLEAAGIKAALTEEETSSLFGANTALTGVHLLVRDEDAEQAGRVLDEAFDPERMDEDELRAQAEAAGTQEADPAAAPPETGRERDDDAGNAFYCALIGFFFAPLLLWAVVLILYASSGPGTLSRRGRALLAAAYAIVLAWFVLVATVMAMLRAE